MSLVVHQCHNDASCDNPMPHCSSSMPIARQHQASTFSTDSLWFTWVIVASFRWWNWWDHARPSTTTRYHSLSLSRPFQVRAIHRFSVFSPQRDSSHSKHKKRWVMSRWQEKGERGLIIELTGCRIVEFVEWGWVRKGIGDWVARQAGEFYLIVARLPLSLMVANCELVLQMTRVKAFKASNPKH